MKTISTSRSREIFEARREAWKNKAEQERLKGNTRVFTILMGNNQQSYFYPVSCSERYVNSLKESNTLPCSDLSIEEFKKLY